MGANGAFERRRTELALVTGVSDVPDKAVVDSFVSSVTPGHANALMLAYLERACIAHIFGSVIFVHGGVSHDAAGWVPGDDAKVEDPGEWVRRLNAWAASQLAEFKLDPFTGGNSKKRAGHALMDYGVPGGAGGRSVVYCGHLKGGCPAKVDSKVNRSTSRGSSYQQ